jgi:hypothetical protein
MTCAAHDIVELFSLQRTSVRTEPQGPHWQHFEHGTRLLVIHPGEDLTLLGLRLYEAIVELKAVENDDQDTCRTVNTLL